MPFAANQLVGGLMRRIGTFNYAADQGCLSSEGIQPDFGLKCTNKNSPNNEREPGLPAKGKTDFPARSGDYGRILKSQPHTYLPKTLAPPGPVSLSLKYRQAIP